MMGTTEQWVVAPEDSTPALVTRHAVRLTSVHDPHRKWAVWRLPFEQDVGRFERRLASLVSETGFAAMSVWIQDSDFALILCCMSRGTLARAIVQPDAADSYAEAHAFVARMPEGSDASVRAIAEWSAEGPRQVTQDEIEEAVTRPSPVVDDAVLALLSLLGLETSTASLSVYDGLRVPFEGKADVGGQKLDLQTLPYFMGSGMDAQGHRFVGIWKRGEPGPPIERFREDAFALAHVRVLQLSGFRIPKRMVRAAKRQRK
jgi:hypothetical protein